MSNYIIFALIGGSLISLSVSLMLLFNGRIAGVSGILKASLNTSQKEGFWRVKFILGIVLGSYIGHNYLGLEYRAINLIFSVFLVGLGAVLSNGCTSGHSICGVSRFSRRSILASLLFMLRASLFMLIKNYVLRVFV